MSQEDVARVREWFDRWNRGERSFMDDEIHPEVEVPSRLRREPYRGREGLREWMREIDQSFQEWRLVTEEWLDAGEGVVFARGHIELRGEGSGVGFDQPMNWVIELSEGRLRRLQPFLDADEARRAAGLAR